MNRKLQALLLSAALAITVVAGYRALTVGFKPDFWFAAAIIALLVAPTIVHKNKGA